jgi:hypothetical protein
MTKVATQKSRLWQTILGLLLLGFPSIGLATPAIEPASCDQTLANSKAQAVGDLIMEQNGLFVDPILSTKTAEDDDYYFVTRSYDLQLSVPSYTFRITKSSCMILDVSYRNFEG